jgi:hypothetical protein
LVKITLVASSWDDLLPELVIEIPFHARHALIEYLGQRSHDVGVALKPNGIISYFRCSAWCSSFTRPRSLLPMLAFEVVRPLINPSAHHGVAVLLRSTRLLWLVPGVAISRAHATPARSRDDNRDTLAEQHAQPELSAPRASRGAANHEQRISSSCRVEIKAED